MVTLGNKIKWTFSQFDVRHHVVALFKINDKDAELIELREESKVPKDFKLVKFQKLVTTLTNRTADRDQAQWVETHEDGKELQTREIAHFPWAYRLRGA